MKKRVVITGLGTLNSIADSVKAFETALKKGICGIGPISMFDTSDFRTHTGGEVKNFPPAHNRINAHRQKRMSRCDHMGMTATLEALRDAGLDPAPRNIAEDMGVVIGGGAGGMPEGEIALSDYLKRYPKHIMYSAFVPFCCASTADHIASFLNLNGPKTTFMTACTSGANAIGYAFDLIQSGDTDIMIAGGAEPLSRLTYASFNAIQSVDPTYCKPFDKNREGLSLAEGAGILILESLDHAQNRRARIHAEMLGYGISCDAHHMTSPDPDASGVIRSMRSAIANSGIHPLYIDYINAHGTATPANDVMETKGIKYVFGKRAYQIPVSATKSMTGHALGAAGAIEAIICALSIVNRFIPPTIHTKADDPECDLDYVSDGVRYQDINVVMSNSFAFGGNNTSIVFSRYTEKGIPNE